MLRNQGVSTPPATQSPAHAGKLPAQRQIVEISVVHAGTIALESAERSGRGRVFAVEHTRNGTPKGTTETPR